MVKPEDGPAETNEPSSGSASGLVKPKPAPAVSKGYAHLFKYIIVGDSGTGKSALLRRYADNEFQATHLPTIGVDFAVKSVSLPNGDEVKLQVWDTAGQERYRTITTSYYRGAMGIIIVYDVTYRETADNVSRWVEECQRYANEDIVIVVVGTKSDMKDGAVDYVSIDDMKTKEALSDVVEGFFEVSAKTGQGVDAAFNCLTDALVAKRLETKNNIRGATVKVGKKKSSISLAQSRDESNTKKKTCC